jgi:hypothetical protein
MARQYHKNRYLPHAPASIVTQNAYISREEYVLTLYAFACKFMLTNTSGRLPVYNPATGEQLSVYVCTNVHVRHVPKIYPVNIQSRDPNK